MQDADDTITSLRFTTRKDYEDWMARLEKLPAYVEQTTALLREGIKEKIVLPKNCDGPHPRADRQAGRGQTRGQPVLPALQDPAAPTSRRRKSRPCARTRSR